MRHLPRLVAETLVDKKVPVTLWRKHALTTVQVKVARLEEESEEQQAAAQPVPKKPAQTAGALIKALGMTLSRVTPELKDKYSLGDDTKGVVVVDVARNSSAADKGFHPGDAIMEAAQEEVKNPEELAAKIDAAKKIRAEIHPIAGRAPGRSAFCRAAGRSRLAEISSRYRQPSPSRSRNIGSI